MSESYEIKGPLDESEDPKPTKKNECTLFLGHKWYRLNVKPEMVDKTNLIK